MGLENAMAKSTPKKSIKKSHDVLTIRFSKKQSKRIRHSMKDNDIIPTQVGAYLARLADVAAIRSDSESKMYGSDFVDHEFTDGTI
jgi:hypothetical protein